MVFTLRLLASTIRTGVDLSTTTEGAGLCLAKAAAAVAKVGEYMDPLQLLCIHVISQCKFSGRMRCSA